MNADDNDIIPPYNVLDNTFKNVPNNNARYSITELSREFNISTRTIRFYEDKQLLHPDRNNKHRTFSNTDHTRLQLILRGKRLGFSLQEISETLSLYQPCNNNRKQLTLILQKIDNRKNMLRQLQQDINTLMSDLSLLEHQCIRSLDIERTDKKTRLTMNQIWAKDQTGVQVESKPHNIQPL